MLQMPLTLPVSIRSFSEYFDLTMEPGSLAVAFGYDFVQQSIELPRADLAEWAQVLRERMEIARPHVYPSSETARREFFISPVFFELTVRFGIEWRIEQPLVVSERLRGSLDYLLEANQQIVVVEAKRDDTDRGLTQLVAEMVAVDEWRVNTLDTMPILYGAVSTGTVWQFLRLQRAEKRFELPVEQFLSPKELPEVIAVLMGILRVG